MSPHSLRLERHVDGDVLRVSIAGELTETARLGEQELGESASKIILDLQGISRINSYGVREWLRFVRKARPGTAIVYERLSPSMVSQANLVADFLPNGAVRSVLAPYYCERCNKAIELLLDVEKDLSAGLASLPTPSCAECSEPLSFDDVPQSYFAFLES